MKKLFAWQMDDSDESDSDELAKKPVPQPVPVAVAVPSARSAASDTISPEDDEEFFSIGRPRANRANLAPGGPISRRASRHAEPASETTASKPVWAAADSEAVWNDDPVHTPPSISSPSHGRGRGRGSSATSPSASNTSAILAIGGRGSTSPVMSNTSSILGLGPTGRGRGGSATSSRTSSAEHAAAPVGARTYSNEINYAYAHS